MNFPDSNIELVGNFIQYKDLLPIAQKYVKNFDGLVVIREKEIPLEDRKRASGTLWYKNQILGFTVEDITRDKKISAQTAIPANLTFISPPVKGFYYLRYSRTGSDFIQKSTVKFKEEDLIRKKIPKNKWSLYKRGVGLHVVTDLNGVDIAGNPDLYFDQIKIHSGTNERSSAGCLIYSRQKNEDGTVKNDFEINKTLVKYAFENSINKIVYIDYFDLINNNDYNLRGVVIDDDILQPINGAKIKVTTSYNPSTPENLKEIYTFTFETTTNENGEFNFRVPPITEYIISTGGNTNIYDSNSSFEVVIHSPSYDSIKKRIVNGDGDYTPDLGTILLPSIAKLNVIPLSIITNEEDSNRYRELFSTPEVEINSKLVKQKGKLNDLIKNIRDNIVLTFFN